MMRFDKSLVLCGGLLLAAGVAAQDGQVEPELGEGEYERLHGQDVEDGLGGHASHSNNVGTSSEVGDVGEPDQVVNTQSDSAVGDIREHDGEDSSASYTAPGAGSSDTAATSGGREEDEGSDS